MEGVRDSNGSLADVGWVSEFNILIQIIKSEENFSKQPIYITIWLAFKVMVFVASNNFNLK